MPGENRGLAVGCQAAQPAHGSEAERARDVSALFVPSDTEREGRRGTPVASWLAPLGRGCQEPGLHPRGLQPLSQLPHWSTVSQFGAKGFIWPCGALLLRKVATFSSARPVARA